MGVSNLILAAADSSSYFLYVMIGLLVLMFGFQFISGRKKNKKRQELLNSIGPGAKILTIGGMYGEIKNITADNKIVVNVGTYDRETLITLDRQSIRTVVEGFAASTVQAPVEEVKEEENK
ncbi:MAG: preprotein translocase subunit YajC [Clostridiales bacterium]|jgi:preprotein translocase subunit YajC|nr:preprotein translocase subunit YajC [Clostridiales bacterium]